MGKHLNDISKKEMRMILKDFLQYNIHLEPDDIKFMKILRFDDFIFESNKAYAIDQLKQLITKVNVVTYQSLDDNLDPIECDWEQLFDDELDKMSKYAIILSNKRPNECNIFETIIYILNAFIDYIYEEVLII